MEVENLKAVRERLGKTIDQVASRVGVSHSALTQWEANPNSLAFNKLVAYADALGLTITDLLQQTTQKEAEWTKVEANTSLQKKRKLIRAIIDKIQSFINDDLDEQTKNYYEGLVLKLKDILVRIRKPRIVLVGESDSGKSTMLNSMLGSNRISTHWQPATSQIIRVVHSDDKPSWVNGNTIVIKSEPDILVESWELLDKKVYDKYIIEEGSERLLLKYGDRDGAENSDTDSDNSHYTIFTYLDAPILNSVELWDTPGISAGLDSEANKEEGLSNYAQSRADKVIYLSVVNQFMHSADIAYLNSMLPNLDRKYDSKEGLPAWNNLYIVGSQAGILKNNEDIPNIINTGYARLKRVLPTNSDTSDIFNGLKERFFTFSSDNYDLSHKLIEQFAEDNKKYQILVNTRTAEQITRIKNTVTLDYNNINKRFEQFKSEEESFRQDAEQARKNLKNVKQGNADTEQKAMLEAERQRNLSKNAFSTYYQKLLNENRLIKAIDSNGFKNKKRDKTDFYTWVKGQLDSKLQENLKKYGKEYAEKYQKIAEEIQFSSKIDQDYFNFKNISVGLISGGISYGALTFLAAQIPSNLGLYLGVGSIAGTLTNLGFISSPVVLTSLIGSTGGPVLWGVGLTVLASSLVVAIFGKSTWKKKLSQKVIKDFNKADILSKYLSAIDNFWNDTIKGIKQTRKGADDVADEQVNQFNHMVSSGSEEYFKTQLDGMSKLNKLFSDFSI